MACWFLNFLLEAILTLCASSLPKKDTNTLDLDMALSISHLNLNFQLIIGKIAKLISAWPKTP